MKVKPHQWSHHHIQRLYHMSMAAIFLFMSLAVCFGVLTAMLEGSAQTASEQYTVSITALVPSIGIGPTETGGGGGPAPEPPPTGGKATTTPGSGLAVPFVTVRPVDFVEMRGDAYVVKNARPLFAGETNIVNGSILLEVKSDLLIRSTTYASGQGNWFWQVPEALRPGMYEVKVVAQDPVAANRTASASLKFIVEKTADTPITPKPKPTQPGVGNPIVYLKIGDRYKQVLSGRRIVADVKLEDMGTAKQPAPVDVEYVVTDSDGSEIAHTTEQFRVPGELSFRKTFYTSGSTESGTYTIMAKVYYAGTVATAQDSFEVVRAARVAETTYPDYRWTLFLLLLLLFMFGFVAYVEYRKVMALSRIIHQVTDEDLKSQVASDK